MTCAFRVSVVLPLLALAGVATGQPYGAPYSPPPQAGVPEPQENVSFGFAEVLRVDPVYEDVRYREPEQRCDADPYGNGGYQRVQGGDPTGGTVIGGLVGGALGNQVGKGDGRKAATVAGLVAGALIGRNIDSRNGSAVAPGPCRMVEVERVERRAAGYDVDYRYKGDVYSSRLPYDPGNRLRIRVGVAPAAETGAYETGAYQGGAYR